MSEENTQTQDAPEQITESSTVETEVAETTTAPETVPKKDFNKVYWKSKESEREVERLKAQLAEKPVVNDPVQHQAPSSNEPTLEQFDYDQDAYLNAMVDHRVNTKIDSAFEAREQKRQQQKQQTEADNVVKKFNDNYAQYAAENTEYQELREASGGKVYSDSVNQAILYSDNGPAVDHHLLRNPQLAEELSGMSPVTAAIRVGQISAELRTTTAQPKTTSAPAPIETVGGGSNSTNDIRYDDNVSMEDYYRMSMQKKRGGA